MTAPATDYAAAYVTHKNQEIAGKIRHAEELMAAYTRTTDPTEQRQLRLKLADALLLVYWCELELPVPGAVNELPLHAEISGHGAYSYFIQIRHHMTLFEDAGGLVGSRGPSGTYDVITVNYDALFHLLEDVAYDEALAKFRVCVQDAAVVARQNR